MSDTPRTDQRAFKAAFLPPEAIVTADFARELERELAKATAERDEARREICNVVGRGQGKRLYAAERGWDCFEKEANTTDVPVQNGGEA
jgi:hypothetical protein